MTTAIEARVLARRFGDTEAVAGVDLTVASGEIYGFLGPNGAGKSTTVRMLTTLLRPTAGTARVAGFDVGTEPEKVRLRIGVALQEAALDPKQTGRELLDLQGRLYGLSRAERHRRVDELLELVAIGDAIDRRIATYSGGMKRRLDLAAALVHQPEVLFLDEPTTGLDPTSRAAVWSEVRYLNEELGITIFLTTQYLEEADALANRVGIIALGKLVAEGTPAELKRSIGSDVIIAKVPIGQGDVAVAAVADVSPGGTLRDHPRHRRRRGRDVGGQRGRRHQPRRGGARRCRGSRGGPHASHAHARRRVLAHHRWPHAGGRSMSVDTGHDPSLRVHPRSAGFWTDLHTISLRAIRLTWRDPEAFGPALVIPVFFFVVNVGALQSFVEGNFPPGFDYKAFQLPVAVAFAVTGVSRANSLVIDIQDGYLDRLLLTPVRRVTLLMGLMTADLMLITALAVPVLVLGLLLGIEVATGIGGIVVFVLLAGLWGLAFTGFPYAIALRTGNPTAVNNAFLLFFPFLFLTTAYLPQESMTGWLATAVKFNPTTYLLDGMRALLQTGWEWDRIGKAVLAVAAMGAVSFTLAFRALAGRVNRN